MFDRNNHAIESYRKRGSGGEGCCKTFPHHFPGSFTHQVQRVWALQGRELHSHSYGNPEPGLFGISLDHGRQAKQGGITGRSSRLLHSGTGTDEAREDRLTNH
jgi:hypothetical protein